MPNKTSGKITLNQIFIFFCLLTAFNSAAINGYKITLKSNLKNHPVYLYYQYGENQYPADTALADANGVAVFEKQNQITGGVYIFYVSPTCALEFLLSNENTFTINTDTANVLGKTSFTGSSENTVYYNFLRKIKFNEFQQDALKNKLRHGKISSDSVKIIKNMISLYDEENIYLKKQTIQKNPNTFIATLLQAGSNIAIPANLKPSERYAYMKLHFFDGINFSDERLAFSPVLFNKYKQYINEYCYHTGDSIIRACDTILKKASAGKENFKWSLYFLSSSFERSAVPGQDKIFVHLVEEYYMKEKCWWLSKEQLNAMYKRSQVLKKLFIGAICPDFNAFDSSEKIVNLHNTIKSLTVLYFWSYDCEHCFVETPKLIKWIKNHPDIQLITACVTPEEERWKQKLKDFAAISGLKKLPGVHVIDPDLKANYVYLYNIFTTPEIFVIDENKKIRAKYISDTHELDDFIKTLRKK